MSGLHVRDVTVRFGGQMAVEAANLDVSGAVVALLGPSGCGKSTLLRAIAGLEPSTGTICWDGLDLAGVPVHRRRFGLMFQDGQLFPYRDVAGNVDYGLAMAHVPRAIRAARTAELLDLVGLPGYERRGIETLSGGERQRVALARALAPRPALLMLDEPLSALDRQLREHLAGEIRRILTEAGQAAIFVTHDQEEAFAVADQVAVMAKGRVVRQDGAKALWRNPGNRQVAEFLGYRWFCPAHIDGGHARTPIGDVALDAAWQPPPPASAPAPASASAPDDDAAGSLLALAAGAVRVVADRSECRGTVAGPARFTRYGTLVPVHVPALGREPIPARGSDHVRGEVFLALESDRIAVISAARPAPPQSTAGEPTAHTGPR